MDLARAPRRRPLTARKKGSGYENAKALVKASLRAGSLGEREPARIPITFTCMRPIFGRRDLIG